jgi:hypothetical protein
VHMHARTHKHALTNERAFSHRNVYLLLLDMAKVVMWTRLNIM